MPGGESRELSVALPLTLPPSRPLLLLTRFLRSVTAAHLPVTTRVHLLSFDSFLTISAIVFSLSLSLSMLPPPVPPTGPHLWPNAAPPGSPVSAERLTREMTRVCVSVFASAGTSHCLARLFFFFFWIKQATVGGGGERGYRNV